MSKGQKPRSTAGKAAGRRLPAGISAVGRPSGAAWRSCWTVLLAGLLTVVAMFVGSGIVTVRAAEPDRPQHTIVFLGDSLTAGYGLENPTAQAYPALIQQKLQAATLPWRVVNAGLSGDTTAGGLRRLDWVLRQPADILFIALGGNDGLRGIDPAVTEHNLEQIVDHARAKYPTLRVVIAGMQMPDAMGEAFVQRYRGLFGRVAEKKQAVLLPFLLEGVGGRAELNQADAIHPTAAGQQIVADNVWKILRPLL
jgi:acyl-CoA thioesterase-1